MNEATHTTRELALLARQDLAQARTLFEEACKASRQQSAIVGDACDKYGERGPWISGIGQDHFPEEVKDTLRTLCASMNAASTAAYAARPSRVRMDTMRALYRAVAKRDGCGFYGPR